jgi:GNAT superfamily N-acetyltransferase
MPAVVRSARPDEAEGLVATYDWLFAHPGSRPATWDPGRAATTLSETIASSEAEVLVAEVGGRLVGACTVYLDIRSVRFGDRAWVEDLSVHPDHRSRGVGKALLEAAKDWGRAHGATHLALNSGTSRTDAHRFYEREGPSTRSLSFGWEL